MKIGLYGGNYYMLRRWINNGDYQWGNGGATQTATANTPSLVTNLGTCAFKFYEMIILTDAECDNQEIVDYYMMQKYQITPAA